MNFLSKINKEKLSELRAAVWSAFAPQAKKYNSVLWAFATLFLIFAYLLFISLSSYKPVKRSLSPMMASLNLHPLKESKKGYQIYGYAPYWTFDKLQNVDFNALTTFAYFGVPVDGAGNLVKDDPGYNTFISDQATAVFKKAHDSGTKVDLTITQMDNYTILNFLDNPEAQKNAIEQSVSAVKERGIDGISVDFEYSGDITLDYRDKFTKFVSDLNYSLHKTVPGSQVTVAVYAISARQQLLYDIAALSKNSDHIFMMAYDFAVAGSDSAEPTAPLYGFKQGKYPYDVSTAVEDFLKVMPAEKLVLGVPYYGYNYSVYQPGVNSPTMPWSGTTQTYEVASGINQTEETSYTSGWDNEGQVGWKAYVDAYGNWRMIFLEDDRSLGIKYDFAKSKNLAGVGIWALGFDDGHNELWSLLHEKFGAKLADSRGLLYK